MDVTYYNYIALAFFVLFALFVPISFLLTSKMLRVKSRGNRVKNTPYESAEQPIGKTRDVANEYLTFFAIFLPFEIMAMVVVLWSISARQLDLTTNIAVIGLAIVSMALALLGYKFASDRSG
jgi:NADH:ubiquinone oxidoreductase subunit 3 (subunit A)